MIIFGGEEWNVLAPAAATLSPNREVIPRGGLGLPHRDFRFRRWNKNLTSLEKGPAEFTPVRKLESIHQLIHKIIWSVL